MLNKDLIYSKINSFIKDNPEYTLYREELFYNALFEQNVLTKEEIDLIKNNISLFFSNTTVKPVQDYRELLGVSFSNNYLKTTPKERIDNLLNKFDLVVDSNFQIDLSNFTLDNLIEKYNIAPDSISESSIGHRSYTEAKFKHLELGDLVVLFFNDDPQSVNILNKNFNFYLFSEGESSYDEYYFSDENNSNWKSFDMAGNVFFERRGEKYIDYLNNMPFIEIDKNGVEKNLVVEALINDLKFFSFSKNLKHNVLNKLTKENVEIVLQDFLQTTGNDLYNEIRKNIFLDNSSKTEVLNYIKSISPFIVAKLICEDIYGLGSGNLKDDLKLLNKDNIQNVLMNYKSLVFEKDKDFMTLFELQGFKDLLVLPLDFATYLNGGVANGIIKNINDELNLDDNEKKIIIDNIINLVISSIDDNKVTYAQDIKADILEHKDNIIKLDVDIMRYGNRFYEAEIAENVNISNGKIDSSYNQHGTGDCWLISAITSILNKDIGKNYIENLIKINEETDCTEVYLPGAEKIYSIKNEYIQNATHLANGDGDIRALELAVETYLKEVAYENNARISLNEGKKIDIDGNFSSLAYKLLLGNSEKVLNLEDIDWNSKNKVYTVAIDYNNLKTLSVCEKITEVLTPHHAYSVLKSDEKFLYLYDPNISIDINNIDEEKIKKIPIEEVSLLRIYSANLPIDE